MNFRLGFLSGALCMAFLGAVGAAAWWIVTAERSKPGAAVHEPAATVQHPIKEEDLATVILSLKAEQRLGVQIGKVQRKKLPRRRLYGAEVTIPIGQSIQVAAPLGGILKAPMEGMVRPGARVKQGQTVLLLFPLLTPEARTTLGASKVDADGQVKNAETQVRAARIALNRVKLLLRDDAGSQRAVDDGQALFELAEVTLEAAKARRDLLTRALGEMDKGTAAPIPIESPQDGVLRSLAVLPDQNVPSGAALFEVVALDRIWIRVPVFAGEFAEIDAEAEALVGTLNARPGEATRIARHVAAPPSANALASTVDLFFGLDNSQGELLPGERVSASLALRGPTSRDCVPWSAIVHDVQGGTWVYEPTAPRSYARRRVAVAQVVNGVAILIRGPKPGTPVVIAGAQELFSEETGFRK